MNIKKIIVVIAVLVVLIAVDTAHADFPTITDVTAQQRYPWNGKVDISYAVTGDVAEEAKQRAVFTSLKVSATDEEANVTYVATKLSGDMALTEGVHSLVWDMDAEGLAIKSSNVVFKVSCETTPAAYCVVDLSAGSDATSYPVTYMAAPPSGGFNVDEYKTTKLVLRRIEAGSFIMGEKQADESHRVTLTKPLFCGIFEVTQRQYELVAGTSQGSLNSSLGAGYGHAIGSTYPVYYVSYNMIRGSSYGANWPSSSDVDASSFIGKLRTRTGIDFDLPTEAQWEYACRAGTSTQYNCGNSGYGDYMWFIGNANREYHPVGTKYANAWGLYDMHGNGWEWCLDWKGDTLTYGNDPKGCASGANRVVRGGYYYSEAYICTSYERSSAHPVSKYMLGPYGFRLVRTLSR